MKLIIGADFVPTDSNKEYFINADIENLVGTEIRDVLDKADFRIFNLEVPLVDKNTPIKKCGPALIAPTKTINGIKKVNVNLFTLANNHILDQGEQGLSSTIGMLNNNNIAYVGVGKNLNEARKPYVIENNGQKIGIYACAEHEFSIATEKNAGANPFDALESFDHVKKLKETCNKVIVLYHGGKEHYRYPSPMLQKVCRKFVEKGADLVVCQHSHCIGCEEKYQNGTIVYGQGNFLFDHSNSEFWQTSLLISIDDEFNISYIPLVKNGMGVELAKGEEKEEILADFNKRSFEILIDGFVDKKYREFAEQMQQRYLMCFSAIKYRSVAFKSINKISGDRLLTYLLKKKYNDNQKNIIRNLIECEAHRELVLKSLSND